MYISPPDTRARARAVAHWPLTCSLNFLYQQFLQQSNFAVILAGECSDHFFSQNDEYFYLKCSEKFTSEEMILQFLIYFPQGATRFFGKEMGSVRSEVYCESLLILEISKALKEYHAKPDC